MDPGERGEILRADGRAEPIERRARKRHLLVYDRSAGRRAGDASVDRRDGRRMADEILRGRLVDMLR